MTLEAADRTDKKDRERADAIQGLRDLADFLEQHPGVPAPTYNALLVSSTKEMLTRIARMASWTKDYGGEYFSLKKEFLGGLTLDIYTSRSEVCRKVVVGERVVPARPAEPERVEEVVEWVCEEALLAARTDPATLGDPRRI
jgi:hypothetical protein